MGWARFDDAYTDHPKVVSAGPLAELLDMRAILFSARYETDGHIPPAQVARIGAGISALKKRISALTDVGRWHAPGHDCTDCPQILDGWVVHGYLDYNPPSAKKEAEREAARERMRKAREAKQAANEARSSEDVRANEARSSPEVQEQFALGSGNPVPSPTPKPSPTGDDATAQTLIGEYVSACKATPPKQHIGHLAKNVKALLDEGYEPVHLRPALERVRAKGLNPATLPSVLNEVLNAANGHGPQPGGKVVIG